MEKVKAFMKRKNIEISLKRYGIDALGAMAQGLFCSLLIGTIINTIGTQFKIGFLTAPVATIAEVPYTVGGLAVAMSGPAMACAIAYALQAPPLVLFSMISVGFAANALGGAGGPLSVLFIAIITAEVGKAVSKETKVDLLVTPLVTIGVGVALSAWWAPALGKAAMKVGNLIMWATDLRPFLMGILVSVIVGIALTLPISSAAIGTSMLQMGNIVKNPRIWIPPIVCSAITGPIATCLFHLKMNGAPVSSGMGTCGFVGQIGVYTGWVKDVAEGAKAAITATDWIGLFLICFILPAVLCPLIAMPLKKIGWIKEGDMKLS